MSFLYNKNNTLYINQNPKVMLDLEGNIAVFYSGILNDGLPKVIIDTFPESNVQRGTQILSKIDMNKAMEYFKNNELDDSSSLSVMEQTGELGEKEVTTVEGVQIIVTSERKFKLFDVDNLRSFRANDLKGYDKIFIVNINHIDNTVIFELLTPLLIQELHANTVGDHNLKRIKDLFSNIKY